tara:strand:- start:689 stop:1747 length:1059 start_codon:yes stop_codon:yes gene_type:complete
MSLDALNTKDYIRWVKNLKDKIYSTQIKAAISVNREMLHLYWEIGKSISKKLRESDWGSSIVDNLATDLKKEFPNQKGFSRSNLFYMKQWYEFYSLENTELEKVQQLVGQIPWGHHLVIISKSRSREEAYFYLGKILENNWSRAVLLNQIESGLSERIGKATTNFSITLTKPQSELAKDTLKDPYKLDFLDLGEKIVERDIERQLVKHITSFLLELGKGFSFVGQQVGLKVDNQDFFIDLLFYHIKLKCYVVIELKAIEFKAEFAGKMNLYLSAVDDQMRTKGDNPTIGLLLCKTKSEIIAEYALRGTTQPIGIAQYDLNKSIPNELDPDLPTIEKIERELSSTIKSTPNIE